ncbi:MAG: LysM domain-containing protein [Candidatus Promineifilaceae bacterium]|nr:LysM domain-containing protein [Candidatus Promineifilaceae bacterium]
MRQLRWHLVLPMIIVGLLITVIAANGAVQAQDGNLLTNPGFEGQYSSYVPELPQEQADCPAGICTTAQTPSGWKPWWVKERPTDVNPEYKPATRNVAGNRVRSGDRAAQYFSFWSTHKAGLRQTVSVPAGAVVQFSVWGHAWMSEQDDPFVSDRSGTPNMRIGIDPTGGINPYSPSIIWSGYQQPYDQYQQFSVQAQAQGDTVTVFTFAAPSVNPNSPDYGFKHTDIYWDDASLSVAGAAAPVAPPPAASDDDDQETQVQPQAAAPFVPGPTPTPDAEGVIYVEVQPGDSLWAIAARADISLDEILELNDLSRDSFVNPGDLLIIGFGDAPAEEAPEEQETETAEASAESALTEEEAENSTAEEDDEQATALRASSEEDADGQAVALLAQDDSGASICLKAFADNNQNGQHDAGEPLSSDVAFTISDGQVVTSNYVTDGESEPFCIRGLAAGEYRVSRSRLSNEVMTTPGDRNISLSEGSTLSLDFGSYEEATTSVAAATEGTTVQSTDAAADGSVANQANVGDSDNALSGLVIVAVIVAVLLLVAVIVVILSGRRAAS